jgi:hypothetical protein
MGAGPSKPEPITDSLPQSTTSQSPQSWKEKSFGRSTIFAKSGLRENFTENYGDSVNMISFLSAVNSRLAYMNSHQFLGHYNKIYGNVIPGKLMEMINTQVKSNGIKSILNDKEMFGEETFGLKTFQSKAGFGGQGLQFLPWAQQINIINGEQRIDSNNSNCDVEVTETIADENLVFVSIATSNYSEIYVVGDKRMPNLVTVIFKGTSDAKSAGSYSKPSSLSAMWTGNINGLDEGLSGENKEKFLFGIYKILMDTVHVLMDSVNHVAEIINPSAGQGEVNIISTGHSLGGGLATIFAYVYVSHISSLPDHSSLYNRLNKNIACFSLGSPRVFSKELAFRFCQLTQNNLDAFKDNEEYMKFIESSKIEGRITYLRIVSYNDPVPMVPKVGYSHPCSDNDTTRKNTNVDCLVQIENSFSTRCGTKRLAMTYNFQDLPLNCVDTKEARENSQKNSKTRSPSLMKNPMSYHTEYLGISYIGGISFDNVFGNNIGRVKEDTKMSKKGNTVCRLLLYPNVQDGDTTKASVGFYDLILKKSKSSEPALNVSDADKEKAESTETSSVEPLQKVENEEPKSTPVKVKDPYNEKILAIFNNMVGINRMVEVPQDIYDTEKAFDEIVKNTETYDIITTISPPINYNTLIETSSTTRDQSFQGVQTPARTPNETPTQMPNETPNETPDLIPAADETPDLIPAADETPASSVNAPPPNLVSWQEANEYQRRYGFGGRRKRNTHKKNKKTGKKKKTRKHKKKKTRKHKKRTKNYRTSKR